MTRFGSAMARIDERIAGVDLPLLSVSQTRGVIRRSEISDAPPRAESLDAYKVCRKNDIVFNKMSIRAGAMGVASEDGLVTYHYEVLRPRPGAHAKYIMYLMKSEWFTGELVARERGIGAGQQANVRTTEVPFTVLRMVDAHIPALGEQRTIADYLDDATVRIDNLIAKQHEMVGLLEERKVAVVASAVSRGTSANVALKPSGVEWVGMVPSHWSILPTRAALREAKEVVGASWSSTPLLSLTKQGVIIRDIESGEGKYPSSFDDYQVVYPSNLVFCLFDIDETPRTVGLVHQRGMITSAYTRYEVNREVADPSYLERYFIAIDDEKRFRPLYTGLRKVIQKPRFRAAPIVLPPLAEQRAIATHVDAETAEIDALMAKTREHIALAKERRSALITAAVTGQFDVRTATREAA